jgi:hypothetical protein
METTETGVIPVEFSIEIMFVLMIFCFVLEFKYFGVQPFRATRPALDERKFDPFCYGADYMEN